MPSKHERLYLGSLAAIEDADSLRSMEFVPRHREHVDRDFLHVHRNLPRHLDGVSVENGTILATQVGNPFHRKDHSRLVIGPHDRDQLRAFRIRKFVFKRDDIKIAELIDPYLHHLMTRSLEPIAGLQNCRMLDRGGDDL